MIKWEGKKANSLVRITKYIRCLGGKKKWRLRPDRSEASKRQRLKEQ